MDDIVKAALRKWPNVPHCYGWLALDARGQWRMRDEACQRAGLMGEVIRHASLREFIQRNYAVDARGCWYFQNGPQRVYVELLSAPFIAQYQIDGSWRLHTGAQFQCQAIYLDAHGNACMCDSTTLARVDDRDLTHLLEALQIGDHVCNDDQLLAWLDSEGSRAQLTYRHHDAQSIPVLFKSLDSLMVDFAYLAKPQPPEPQDKIN